MGLADAVHRMTSLFDWGWAGVTLAAGAAVARREASASASPSALADPSGSGGGLLPHGGPWDDWNATIVLVTVGLAMIGGKLIELSFMALKGWRSLDSETDRGKLKRCLSDFEQLEKDLKDQVLAERTAHQRDADRLKEQHENVCRDYEERIVNKRQEIEYLHRLLEASHASEQQKMLMIESLNSTLVQISQASGQIASRATELARKNAENTGAAIQRIQAHAGPAPPAPPCPDVAVIAAPVGRVDVVLPADPPGGGGEAGRA